MNTEVLGSYDVMSVAEGAGNSFEDAHKLVDEDRNELNMAYAFDGVDIAKPEGYSLLHFKDVFSRWDSAFAKSGWLSIFLANHDQARMVSRFGNDKPAFRDLSSKMLTTFILSMRGTSYYYYGDELGMTNAGFTKIEDYRDMPTLNEYQNQKNKGGDLQKFMKRIAFESRDNGRTPFQWNSSPNAGFTTGTPWLKVNPNYTMINAAAQEKDPNSCLNYFRKMVNLRKTNPALVYGKYTLLDKPNSNVYAYTREYEGQKFLIVLNFSAGATQTALGINAAGAKLLLGNYKDAPVNNIKGSSVSLRPYEALVYKL
jgi:oligo-1,6-glucosidase